MAYKRKNTEDKKDFYQEVTNEIIEAMDKGYLPWQKGWDSKVGAALGAGPINGATGRAYTKENVIRLMIAMSKRNSEDPRFFTFKQAQSKGYRIKEGAKGIFIKQGFLATKDLAGNPLPEEDQHFTTKYVYVFHASDVAKSATYIKDETGKQVYVDAVNPDGTPMTKLVKDKTTGELIKIPLKKKLVEYEEIPAFEPKAIGYTHDEQMQLAEEMLQNSGAKILNDQIDRAFYEMNRDEIHLPLKEAFPKLENYYATALHELGHWTGHPDRLKRDLTGGFGSISYAKEELRAEMASVFLSLETGLPIDTMNHAAYLQNWKKILQNDKMEFFNAVNDARKITKYIKDLVQEKMRSLQEEKKEDPLTIDAEAIEKESEPIQEAQKTPGKEWHQVEIFQIKGNGHEVPWKFESWDSAMEIALKNKMPLDFQAYEKKVNDTYRMDANASVYDLLANVYSDYNQGQEGSAAAKTADAHSCSMSDIIRVDGEQYFYVDTIGFQPLQITTLGNKAIMSAITQEVIQQTIDSQSEAVGSDVFSAYRKNFRQLMANGANRMDETFTISLDMDVQQAVARKYEKYIFDNSLKYGLSGIRPCDTKAWEKADSSFIEKIAVENHLKNTIVQAAVNAVWKRSPIVPVAEKTAPNYAMRMYTEAKKLPLYQDAVKNNSHTAAMSVAR